MKTFGLVGKNIDYSFSRSYFTDKFKKENLNCIYKNFDIHSIDEFDMIFKTSKKISGLNVTIPYKEAVLPFLDALDADAESIGAVNTIKFQNGKRIGYNTDHYGFEKSLKPYLNVNHKSALILGTGGASKAIAFALNNLNIPFSFVSRIPDSENCFGYDELNSEIIAAHKIIINCTPLGTHPKIELYPPIPDQAISKDHFLYDLIYNPSQTQFLNFGLKAKATAVNGRKMLELQAERSWETWDS